MRRISGVAVFALIVAGPGFGQESWQRTYGGPGADLGYSVQQTSDGGFVVAGVTYSFGAGSNDAYLIKTESSGQVAIQEKLTITTTPPPGPSLSAAPNPFKSRTILTCRLPAAARITDLRIRDVSGRTVRVLSSHRKDRTSVNSKQAGTVAITRAERSRVGSTTAVWRRMRGRPERWTSARAEPGSSPMRNERA